MLLGPRCFWRGLVLAPRTYGILCGGWNVRAASQQLFCAIECPFDICPMDAAMGTRQRRGKQSEKRRARRRDMGMQKRRSRPGDGVKAKKKRSSREKKRATIGERDCKLDKRVR